MGEPDEFSSRGSGKKTGRALLEDLQAPPVLARLLLQGLCLTLVQAGRRKEKEEISALSCVPAQHLSVRA